MDLRTYLDSVRRLAPERLVEVMDKHDINLEVCAMIADLEKRKREPLLLFSNIDNLSGEPSEFPLLMNTFASRAMLQQRPVPSRLLVPEIGCVEEIRQSPTNSLFVKWKFPDVKRRNLLETQ